MSTIPLWRVLELTDDPGNGRTIGLDSYPIFDEKEREGLNRLIIDHFYLRDIGQETISIFTFMLKRTMREIMPLYNQLYLSQKIEFNPLATYDLTTVRDGTVTESGTSALDTTTTRNGTETENGTVSTDSTTTRNGTDTETGTAQSDSTTTSSADAGSRVVNFDTPQTALSGDKDYASAAADSNSTNASNGTSTGTNTTNGSSTTHGTDEVAGTNTSSDTTVNDSTDATTGTNTTSGTAANTDTSRTTGFQGSAAKLLNDYRSTILNIDRQLLADPELTSMFLSVWDDGSEIAPPRNSGRY